MSTIRFNKVIGEDSYKKVLADAPQGLGATTANIQRLLRSLDFVGWSSYEESGRLDRRALTRFASGSANIFSRRMNVPCETSAVSILIDCSGSMHDKRIENAQSIAVHLSSILSRSRVPFSVNGFYSSNSSYEKVLLDGKYVGDSEQPTFIAFKPWNKSLQACAPALGSILQCCTGGTPDYSSIYYSIEELSRRTENRKILFLITDANGYVVEHMRHLQSLADKLGVVIVAIGICAPDVVKCFVNSVSIRDLSTLASSAFNAMLKTVERKMR